MALPDLTGQQIQDTYQRVLQTDGSILYDGTGSVVDTLKITGSFKGDGSGLTNIPPSGINGYQDRIESGTSRAFISEESEVGFQVLNADATFNEDAFFKKNVTIDENLITPRFEGGLGDGGIQVLNSSALLFTRGFKGQTSASLGSGPAGFVIYSGSATTQLGADTLQGTGFKFVGTDNSSSISFSDQNGGDLEIRTDKFTLQNSGDITASNALFSGTAIARNFIQKSVILSGSDINGSPFDSYLSEGEGGYSLYLDGTLGGEIVNNVEFALPFSGLSLSDIVVKDETSLTNDKITISIRNRNDSIGSISFEIRLPNDSEFFQTLSPNNIYTFEVSFDNEGQKTITPIVATDLSIPVTASSNGYRINGDVYATNLYGTASYASYAVSASHEIIKEVSSSFADTASYVNPLNQDVTITGNVGIGIGNPSLKLQVRGSGTTSSTTALRVENANASASLVITDDSLIQVANPPFTTSTAADFEGILLSNTAEIRSNSNSGGRVAGFRLFNPNTSTGQLELYRAGVVTTQLTSGDQTVNNYSFVTYGNFGLGTSTPDKGKLVISSRSIRNDAESILYVTGSTSDSYDLARFVSDDTARVVITNSGNVGIGTTSPQGLFHVSGSGKILLGTGGGSPTEGCFEFTPAGSVDFRFKNSAGDRGVVIKTNTGAVGGSGGSKIYGAAGGITLEGAFGQENLSLTTDGKVGINNTSPQQHLDIADTTTAPVLRLSRNQNIGGTSWVGESLGDIEFYTNDPSNPRVYGKISVIGGPNSGTPNLGFPDGHMVFSTAGQQGGSLSEKMRITDEGKVGIGTTSPDASAILDITSTTKGVVFPRMTSAQRTSISSPTTGLIVYQTDSTEGLYIYKSTGWVQII